MIGIIQDRIENHLLECIRNGQVNDLLPSQNQLSNLLRANHITVRKVLKRLEENNYIYRIQGKGTFIKMVPGSNVNRLILVVIPSGWELFEGGVFFSIMFNAILQNANKFNFRLKIIPFAGDVFEIINSKADGIIWMGAKNSHAHTLEVLKEKHMSPLLLNRVSNDFDFVSVNYKAGINQILEYYFQKGIRNFVLGGIITSNIYPVHCLQIVKDFFAKKQEKIKIFAECFIKYQHDIVAHREKELLKKALEDNEPVGALVFQYSSLKTIFQVQKEMNISNNNLEIALFDEFLDDIPQRKYVHEIIEPVNEIGKNAILYFNKRFNDEDFPKQLLLPAKLEIKKV